MSDQKHNSSSDIHIKQGAFGRWESEGSAAVYRRKRHSVKTPPTFIVVYKKKPISIPNPKET